MPYVSNAQRKFFNANRDKIGESTVDEWNDASRGVKAKDLPEKVKPKKKGGSAASWAKKKAASG